MLLWFHLVIPSFPARIDDMRSRFSALSPQGDSLVLHCASLLRTIFASLARANERARVKNARDFPQTKLDSEINARFLLNENGDPHFLFYKFNENNILNY